MTLKLKHKWEQVIPLLDQIEPGQSVLVGDIGPGYVGDPFEIVRDTTEMWYVSLWDNDEDPRPLGSFTTSREALYRIEQFEADIVKKR